LSQRTSCLNQKNTFSIVHVGDLHLGDVETRGLDHITDWIKNNQKSQNIRLVTNTGDLAGELVDGSEESRAAHRIVIAMAKPDGSNEPSGHMERVFQFGCNEMQLDTAQKYFLRPLLELADEFAIGISIGNHDYDYFDLGAYQAHGNSEKWRARFGDSVWEPYRNYWYGGKSPEDESHYQIFTDGAYEFLNISLEWFNGGSSPVWLKNVLDAHREKPTIISTHSYLVPWSYDLRRVKPEGEDIWSVIKEYPQVFLILSGHVWGLNVDDSIATRIVKNTAGLDVLETVTDFQGYMPEKGWIRLFTIDTLAPADNITVTTIITEDGSVDASEDYTASLDFNARFGPPRLKDS
jgi:hypothetical protein